MTSILYFCLSAILTANISGAVRQADSLDWITTTPNADMAYYRLYTDNKNSDPKKAYKYAELFLSKLDSLPHNQQAVRICDELASWYENEVFLFSKAIQWREESHNTLKAMGLYNEAAGEDLAIARIQLKKGMYHLALKHAFSAAKVFSDEKDTLEMMECYSILGTVFETCRDYERAEKYFDKYISLAYERQDTARMFVGLNNTAVSSNTLGDMDKTIHLLEESAQKALECKDSSMLCQIYLNLAAMYMKTGNFDKSSQYFNSAFPMINTVEERNRYHLYYGNLCFLKKQFDTAAVHFTKAATYFEKGEYYSVLSETLPLLAESLMMTEKPEQAYGRLKQLNDISRKTDRENVFMEFFRTKYEFDFAELQKREESDRHRLYTFMSIIGVIMVAAISCLITRCIVTRRQFAKAKEDLKSREDTIENLKIKQMQYDRIIEHIIGCMSDADKQLSSEELRKITADLNTVREEESMKQIRQFIPGADKEFYHKLIKDFPNLSVNESRLCVLLNQNLSTKEICAITMQTPQSLNVARTRLRKRLGLTGKDISIQEFLRKYN